MHLGRKPLHWPTIIYNAVWAACFCWFIWFLFSQASRPETKDAGVPALAIVMAIAIAPSAALWVFRRIYFGKWVG